MPQSVRLAIVEDESLFRDLLKSALSALAAIDVLGAFGDAQQALEEIPALGPDVVLMDIDLGSSHNGLQLGLQLRRHLPKLGIVLLSNHRNPAYLKSLPAYEAEGWSYLLKTSVRDVATLERAIHGTASGLVILDPRLANHGAEDNDLAAGLSERRRLLLSLIAQGYSNAAIAKELIVTEKTVENQIGLLYRQLGIDSTSSDTHARVQAVLRYLSYAR